MYNVNRMDAYFRGELDKFIKVTENHTRKENTLLIHCPCRVFGNLKVFRDPTTIRSHVIVSGFVKDYMIWKNMARWMFPLRRIIHWIKSYMVMISADFLMLIMIIAEITMVSALMMERVYSIVMMSMMTGPLIVIVVKMNLTTEIF